MSNPELRDRLKRRAIVFDVGGVRPSEKQLASWFGRVNVGAAGEAWPTTEGDPMHALCQINLSDLPFRPSRLDDIEMITVFVGPRELPTNSPNGRHWCLRSYKDVTTLLPIDRYETESGIKPLPMRPRVVEEDFPCWEDVPVQLPEEIADNYYDLFENVCGLKLGGWPSLIQSEIVWAPWNKHPAAPEYVFQVDSEPKANWSWGDGGVGYFGRGTLEGKDDEWACEWQCY